MSRGGARSGAGRKPKAPELKQLTERGAVSRDDAAAEDRSEPMIAPAHLSETARAHFNSIVQLLDRQRRAKADFVEHVALLAMRLEQIQRFQSVIEVMGDTYESQRVQKLKDGTKLVSRMIRARPEIAMLSDAMRHTQSLLGELMLNPAAALKISSGHKPSANPFANL